MYVGPPVSKMKNDEREVKERWEGNREGGQPAVKYKCLPPLFSPVMETETPELWRADTVVPHGGLHYFFFSSFPSFVLRSAETSYILFKIIESGDLVKLLFLSFTQTHSNRVFLFLQGLCIDFQLLLLFRHFYNLMTFTLHLTTPVQT